MAYEYPEDDDYPVVSLDDQDSVRVAFEAQEAEIYGDEN